MEPADLLERALPPLPPDLQIAPLRQLRGRIRRRRRVRFALLTAVVLTVGVGIGVPLAGRKSANVAWQYARVDRTGMILTLFAAGTCLAATTRADSREVVITVRLVRRHCDRVVHLAASLGPRTLIDGSDGLLRQAFLDSELPTGGGYVETASTPGGSAQDPVSTVTWTRPGGPDLRVTARASHVPVGEPLGTRPVGPHTGTYYADGSGVELRWESGDLVYELEAEPAVTLPRLQALVATLTWRP
jgi:hypothetical protein